MKKVRINLTNEKFGKLTVLQYAFTKNNQAFWQCLCECGNKKNVRTQDLRSGKVKSCGCLRKQLLTTHGLHNTRIYKIWNTIKGRCYNLKNTNYKYYGERGIKMCDSWKTNFISFYNWAISNGYRDNLTIDRINNNGNYEPSNCRWVTKEVQSWNTRQNHLLTYKNETHCIGEWAKIIGLCSRTLRARINRGWTVERAFTQNLQKKG